jgi:hypothetical protein
MMLRRNTLVQPQHCSWLLLMRSAGSRQLVCSSCVAGTQSTVLAAAAAPATAMLAAAPREAAQRCCARPRLVLQTLWRQVTAAG